MLKPSISVNSFGRMISFFDVDVCDWVNKFDTHFFDYEAIPFSRIRLSQLDFGLSFLLFCKALKRSTIHSCRSLLFYYTDSTEKRRVKNLKSWLSNIQFHDESLEKNILSEVYFLLYLFYKYICSDFPGNKWQVGVFNFRWRWEKSWYNLHIRWTGILYGAIWYGE